MNDFKDVLTQKLNAADSFEVPAAAPGQMTSLKRRVSAPPPEYDLDQRVFVLHVPYCKRCATQNEFEEKEDTGCPHTDRKNYLSLLQNCRDKGYILLHWKEDTLKDGTVQASCTWGVPREVPAKIKRNILTM